MERCSNVRFAVIISWVTLSARYLSVLDDFGNVRFTAATMWREVLRETGENFYGNPLRQKLNHHSGLAKDLHEKKA